MFFHIKEEQCGVSASVFPPPTDIYAPWLLPLDPGGPFVFIRNHVAAASVASGLVIERLESCQGGELNPPIRKALRVCKRPRRRYDAAPLHRPSPFLHGRCQSAAGLVVFMQLVQPDMSRGRCIDSCLAINHETVARRTGAFSGKITACE